MGNGRRLALFIVVGFVVAFFLVWGGVLLGTDPSVGRALQRVLPAGMLGGSDGYRLQQEVMESLRSSFYKPVDEEKLYQQAVDGMVESLEDPYTVYLDPDKYADYRERTSGSYSGVGMVVLLKDRLVTIASTFAGSPADQAGIVPGDIIVAVDGVSTEGLSLEEVVSSIKGPDGSTVTLTMYRAPVATTTTTVAAAGARDEAGDNADGAGGGTTDAGAGKDTGVAGEAEEKGTAELAQLPPGGETKEYVLTRREIEVPATESEYLAAGAQKVAHIRFFSFSDGSAQKLREEVKKAVEAEGVAAVILDLRGNAGGFVDEAVSVASIFIDKGVIVTHEGLHSPEEVYAATGGAYKDVPLYVLTDPYSASASEIVSGAMQDYDRATLVGETTFGKGLVQSVMPLTSGGALIVTIAVYLTPEGRNIHETGIDPDVTAPDDPATADVDETVEAALKLITGSTTSAR